MAEMKTPQQTRDMDTRAASERKKTWAPPALLPDPVPETGFAFRWIRTSTLNAADPMNISSKLREGWEPVKAETQPQMMMLSPSEGRFRGCIEVGGLLLCRIPEEFLQQREAYYANQSRAQMESVDNNFLKDSDPRMPLFSNKQSKVTFGSGG